LAERLQDFRMAPIPTLDGNPLFGPLYLEYFEVAEILINDPALKETFAPLGQKIRDRVKPFVETDEPPPAAPEQ
jgi:hypothetical protein